MAAPGPAGAQSPSPGLKIFACTSYGPHTALTGGRLRRDNLLAALAERGHEIDRLNVPGRPGPRSALAAGRAAVTPDLRQRVGGADVVLLGDVFCLPMMPVLARLGRPTVIDLVDSPYRLVGSAPRSTTGERVKAVLESAQLLPVMQVLLPMTDAVTYISADDAEADRARVRRLPPTTIVPNGVSADLFALPLTPPPANGYLAWLADWTYAPNRESYAWFVEEVSPLLPDDVLGRIRTFGAGDPRTNRGPDDAGWRRARTLIGHAGFVDSLSQVYEEARGIVAPVVRGAGVNNKVLEPLAAGRSVITTTVGTRGLSPEICGHLRVGRTGEAFAAQILELLGTQTSVAEAERARDSVRSLSWAAAGETMERALLRATGHAG